MSDPFDLDDFLPYLLNRAAEATGQTFQRHYKARYGMLRTEWRVLFHLGRYGDLTASQICARADLHKTKVSRAVAALHAKRFVTRETTPDDRRHAKLSLTKAGHAAFADLVAEAERYNARLLAPHPPAERAVLRRFLMQLSGRDPLAEPPSKAQGKRTEGDAS